MNLEKELSEIFNFTFIEWLKDIKTKKAFIAVFIVQILFSIIFIYYLINSISLFQNINELNPMDAVPQIINLFSQMGLIIIPFSIIILFINYKIIFLGLKLVKKRPTTYNFIKFLKFIFYPIFVIFAAFFSIYNFHFLAVGIVGILIMILGGATVLVNPLLGGIFIILGLLLSFTYWIIIIINSIRLSLGQIIFVEKDQGIFQTMKKSYNVTQNNVLNILVIMIIFGFLIMIGNMLVTIPSQIYLGLAFPNLEEVGIEILTDPIYYILLIPTYIFGSYLFVCSNLIWIKIYSNLTKK